MQPDAAYLQLEQLNQEEWAKEETEAESRDDPGGGGPAFPRGGHPAP